MIHCMYNNEICRRQKSIGNAQDRIGKQIGTQHNKILKFIFAGITPQTM